MMFNVSIVENRKKQNFETAVISDLKKHEEKKEDERSLTFVKEKNPAAVLIVISDITKQPLSFKSI